MYISSMEKCKETTLKWIEKLRINEEFPNNISKLHYWHKWPTQLWKDANIKREWLSLQNYFY
jgi:hypothetical protein